MTGRRSTLEHHMQRNVQNLATRAALVPLVMLGLLPLACGIHSEVGHAPGSDGAAGGAGTPGGPDGAVGGAATPGGPDGAAGGAGTPGGHGGSAGGTATPDGGSQPPNDGGVDGAVPVACASPIGDRIPAAPLRSLDNFEYRNTVHDLVGLDVAESDLPLDGWPGVSADEALGRATQAYHTIAHRFAVDATKDAAAVAALTSCDFKAMGEDACQKKLLDGLVSRLFRRPLDADDVADFGAIYKLGREQGGDFASGVRAVMEVALQSPEVLYRVELGEAADPKEPRLGRPRPFEMATRLSYLLWGSAPDDALWQAAAQNALQTKDQIAASARRMLADKRTHEVANRFFLKWLRVPSVSSGTPGDLQASYLQETAAFLEDVVWSSPGDLKAVLTSSFSYVNGPIATAYGITGITGNTLQKKTLPSTQRRGLLTQGTFLTAYPSTTSRGLRIRQQLLCGQVMDSDPLASMRAMLPAQAANQTHRQYLESVTQAASCAGCHQQLDPIGFAFGHYDSRGAWMDTESASLPIDAHGQLADSDAAGSFDGALQLVDRLAASRDVLDCHVQKWMELAYGRPVAPADACSQAVLQDGFAATGGNISDLMIKLTQTEAFLYRPTP
jgi:hypothetical protein